MNKTILITGGSGFIGSNLILELKKTDAKIINLTRHPTQMAVKTYTFDISDKEKLNNLLKKENPNYVIHLAALSSPYKTSTKEIAQKDNINATKIFLEVLKNYKIKKLIFTSTSLVYDRNEPRPFKETTKLNPNNHEYVRSKLEQENLIKEYAKETKTSVVIFRVSNTYGPYMDWKNNPLLISQVIIQALKEKKMNIRNGTSVRDWIFIGDVVNALMLSLERDIEGTFNLASGSGESVGKIVKYISKKLKVPYEVEDKDAKEDIVTIDNTKIRKELNWNPKITLEKGLDNTIEYFQKVLK